MDIKNVRISSELHERILKECKKNNLKIGEYVELCIAYFVDGNINPKKPVDLKELRDTFVTFLRTQEKNFHKPVLESNARMVKEIDSISHNVLAIKNDLKVKLKDK
ncbi:BfmA/BtgA family mobilization protein [uncultured Flavobacterium sp.]|uniref:BfmA/BtgA family mobilization protein n=1 Tax=uncultured Flavobacterium sp. TaxID=165435 RepID=UPI00259345A7|nr:BfmA/BtgA family mobilization protein [uncultured Flavobacterium sp.]